MVIARFPSSGCTSGQALRQETGTDTACLPTAGVTKHFLRNASPELDTEEIRESGTLTAPSSLPLPTKSYTFTVLYKAKEYD